MLPSLSPRKIASAVTIFWYRLLERPKTALKSSKAREYMFLTLLARPNYVYNLAKFCIVFNAGR